MGMCIAKGSERLCIRKTSLEQFPIYSVGQKKLNSKQPTLYMKDTTF